MAPRNALTAERAAWGKLGGCPLAFCVRVEAEHSAIGEKLSVSINVTPGSNNPHLAKEPYTLAKLGGEGASAGDVFVPTVVDLIGTLSPSDTVLVKGTKPGPKKGGVKPASTDEVVVVDAVSSKGFTVRAPLQHPHPKGLAVQV